MCELSGCDSVATVLDKTSDKRQVDHVVFDMDKDGDYFHDPARMESSNFKLHVPLLDEDKYLYAPFQGETRNGLTIDVNPSRQLSRGRLGHLAISVNTNKEETGQGFSRSNKHPKGATANTGGNCIAVPIPGAAPLCALVSTRSVSNGEEIIRSLFKNKRNMRPLLLLGMKHRYLNYVLVRTWHMHNQNRHLQNNKIV